MLYIGVCFFIFLMHPFEHFKQKRVIWVFWVLYKYSKGVNYSTFSSCFKAADLQNTYTKQIISYKYLRISLQIYRIVVRNKKNLHIFTFLL